MQSIPITELLGFLHDQALNDEMENKRDSAISTVGVCA